MLVDAVSDKAKDNTPAFCTGDFNATPDAPEIATTICQSGILKDAYREAAVQHGALFTFPSKKTRIDFIFVKHATVLSTRTIVSSLSDHYPMVIVVEIKNKNEDYEKQILSYKYILGNEILDHFMDGYFIFLML